MWLQGRSSLAPRGGDSFAGKDPENIEIKRLRHEEKVKWAC